MKHKIIKTVLFCIVIVLVVFAIHQIAKYEVSSIQANIASLKSSTSSAGTLVQGETDPDTYSYNTHTGTWEAVDHNNWLIPERAGYEIYCAEPGGQLKYDYELTYEEVLSKVMGRYNRVDCTRYGVHALKPYEGDRTPIVFREKETKNLTPAAAYIVSLDPTNSWSGVKQQALWELRDKEVYNAKTGVKEDADGGLIIGDKHSSHESSTIYDQEALDYAEYDYAVRDVGLEPEDKTDEDKIYVNVDQDKQEAVAGPFNVTYTEATYGNVTFGGISEMKIIGYNSEKQEVNSNIAVKRFLLKDKTTGIYGNSVTPAYFEPTGNEKVDRTTQVYPSSGQDFYVVFDNPNVNLSDDSPNKVAYISIKIKFKYMLANGQYTHLEGTRYVVRYEEDHTYNPHTEYTYTPVAYTDHSDCTGEWGYVYPEDGGAPTYEFIHEGEKRCKTSYRDEITGSFQCHGCVTSVTEESLEKFDCQDVIAADAIRSVYEQEIEIGKFGDDDTPPPEYVDITMSLGGHVWEDGVATKESKADGVSNTSGDNIDKPLKNVKVTLYTSDGKVATLMTDPNEAGISSEELMHRINPTYTDEDGNYLFRGLDPMKKYYVKFEYNGQIYLPTEYLNTADKQFSSVSQMVNAKLYNTDSWKVTSKGTETVNDRNSFDQQFIEIGSYPNSYNSSNSLNRVGSKNTTFTQKELMGYTLNREGKYVRTAAQLIDGYTYDENGNETTTYQEGAISQSVRQYIQANKKFPDDSAMRTIYANLAGNVTELWQKLQFIEDCKIESYTQGQGRSHDLYPVYDQFRIQNIFVNQTTDSIKEIQDTKYDTKPELLDGVIYYPIYPGQLFVNQGLWRRQEFDAATRKDVYRVAMKINNKTVTYKYDKRSEDEKYWDINVRLSDYDAYYNTSYNREVYRADYDYSSQSLNRSGNDLEIYVTYKITIRNQSQSIMSQIREVVDYYDKDYTYRDDLSWITYTDGNKRNTVSDNEYYNAMVAEDVSKIANARNVKAATTSRYGSQTHSDITRNYNAIYIQGLESKKLATGESAYIYLTFQVNKQNGKVILDEESSPKMNYAEINGYITYYKDNTSLPNNVTKNSNNYAGLIDRDSKPGNLYQSDIDDKDRYEKNFEDDTDRAVALRIIVDEDAVRKVNGTVWEDERTNKSGSSIIGDGVRQGNETKIAGVTVQLVEKTVDGKEYVWQEATTDSNGYYSFEGYIPGDYVVRFFYGNSVSTAKITGNNDYSSGGQNSTSYNGQDFKSTIYQTGITQRNYTDNSNRYTGYRNTLAQNETGTYGYDIYAADNNQSNVSDAKDLWSVSNRFAISYNPNATIYEGKAIQGRQTVNLYSSQNLTNHRAEVLASPYDTPTYNGTKYTTSEMDALINELIQNTYMTAETGVISVEVEYDRQQSEGLKTTENNSSNSSKDYVTESNRYNGGYTLANIDLGLTERPKAQLEIDKSITNLKITLANNTVLFDVNKAGDNVIWKDHTEYNLASKKGSDGKYEEYYGRSGMNRYSYRAEVDRLVARADRGLIQITMDEALMQGATIEITYKVKITNVGEVDYEGQSYYYLGNSSGANIVTTTANQVVDYVANNLQFNAQNAANQNWSVIQNTALVSSQNADTVNNLVNRRLNNNVKQYNDVIQTEGLNNALRPGESTEKTLVLTQSIVTNSTSDDLTYSNIIEIVKTSNTVGRRMAYSVAGNQDPTASAASEVDASLAERVIILPPFGDTHIFYILGAVIALILIGGITFIIKKVLKK